MYDNLEALPFRYRPKGIIRGRSRSVKHRAARRIATGELVKTPKIDFPIVITDLVLKGVPNAGCQATSDGTHVHSLDPDIRIIDVQEIWHRY